MFFTRYLSKMLFVMGLATASVFIFAIAPQWAIVNILRLPYSETFATNYFDQGHYLIYQHWGVMVGFMGVVMVVAAFKQSWRNSVVFYSFAEKFLMVLLFVGSRGFANENTHGFFPVIIVDTIVSVWTIGYWIEQRSMFPNPAIKQQPRVSGFKS
ncbi:hypothetical protein VB780_05670 [Leptolyngbya sp. CCNP1308]|uniref:hypothetical protein n=1 Tax=Leptolyngbya sp. CCNP1308 TaxID=3110255 RepID=UPI002B20E0F8|nr:hypothetical protein [Leptolyngbya sp. CCNP1308]MEA5448048.1 hypothetical protein [Leptolyngbya sp. CCNP1308]